MSVSVSRLEWLDDKETGKRLEDQSARFSRSEIDDKALLTNNALHLQRIVGFMKNAQSKPVQVKTATLPSLRVSQALRQAAEEVLQEGESLSSFIEQSLNAGIERRRQQQEFIARGLVSRDEARNTAEYFSAANVLADLDKRLSKSSARRK